MKVLFGTTNQAKLDSMRQAVAYLDLEIIGLKDLNQLLPYVDESGKDPLVNAELKARAYYDAFHLPVFSCDSGLFLMNCRMQSSLEPMLGISAGSLVKGY